MLVELAAAVRDGKIHPRELVEESLRRIDQLDPAINAVVSRDDELALATADAHPRAGALAGIPVLVKDLIRAAGLRTSYGSRWYDGAQPDTQDDAVVARLKAAGAIVVGKSNTPAFGHQAVTTNQVTGTTRNPWNLDRSPGGSSGGSSAALAAALVPLATSTDGGGSVRIPASLTGLVGYKPTTGGIGRSFGAPRWMAFSTAGCTGRSVADVMLEASVVLGATPGDVMSVPAHTIAVAPTRPKHVLMCTTFGTAIDPVIAAAFGTVADTLSDAGFDVGEARVERSMESLLAWVRIANAELAQSLAPFKDRWDEAEPTLAAQLNAGVAVALSDYIAAQRTRYDVCGELDGLLGGDTVIVTLTSNATSYPAEGPMPTTIGPAAKPGSAFNTPQLNFTGHPAVSVPLGHDESNVPFGLQVIGPRWRDGLALGLAEVWEQLRPWPTVAAGYTPWPVL